MILMTEKPHCAALSAQMQAALNGLAEGKSRDEVARQMGISTHTLNTYLRRGFKRLQAHSAPEAVAKALRLGLLGV